MAVNEHSASVGRTLKVVLYQWDTGQKIVFSDAFVTDGVEAQFDDGSTKIVIDSTVTVPDRLLQTAGRHSLWVQAIGPDHETTRREIQFDVLPRAQKSGYIEPEDEPTFRAELEELVAGAVESAASAKATLTEAEEIAGQIGGYVETAVRASERAVISEAESRRYAELAAQHAGTSGWIRTIYDDGDGVLKIELENVDGITFADDGNGRLIIT